MPGMRRVANIADETHQQMVFDRQWPIMQGYADGYMRTAPVGSFDPNPWGLYDITGNVIEWTADWYDTAYYQNSPSHNPVGPPDGESKAVRGGSAYSEPKNVRSTARGSATPTRRSSNVGFRCAKTP